MKVLEYTESVLKRHRIGYKSYRALWPDNARILATLAGPIYHFTSDTLNHMVNIGSSSWWIANYYAAMTPWCIMVFVMISGMFLLDPNKDESVLFFYKKRASRVLIPLICWTIFYLLWTYFKGIATNDPVSLRYLAKSVLLGRPYYHMWYLYMTVGLYLLTPFLRKIIRQSSDSELTFFCILGFTIGACAFAANCYFKAPQVSAIVSFIFFVPYFVAGYLIGKTKINPPSGLLIGIVLFLILLTGLGNYFLMKIGFSRQEGYYFYDFLSITVIPMSLSMMFLLKKLTRPVFSPGVTGKLALLSFGVYLIHPIFIDLFKFLGVNPTNYNVLLSLPIIAALIFLGSLAVSFIIAEIPVVKKVIGM